MSTSLQARALHVYELLASQWHQLQSFRAIMFLLQCSLQRLEATAETVQIIRLHTIVGIRVTGETMNARTNPSPLVHLFAFPGRRQPMRISER